MKSPTLLIILDGFGTATPGPGNAISAAHTPTIDHLLATYPHTLIGASGMDVGLPEGQMGNSEVGHTNIGAGRVVYQELTRITKSISDGDFFENPALLKAVLAAKQKGTALHLIGLLSDGGVHSHNTHLYALLRLAKTHGLTRVFVHALMDGRDVPPTSGKGFIEQLQSKITEIGVGQIATITGRYYAMDRDNRWERVEKAYAAMVWGEGELALAPEGVMQASYDAGITDEFVLPTVCARDASISDSDSVIFFNFRPDRAREITRSLTDPDFTGFPRRGFPQLTYVCMTQYDAAMPGVSVAFAPQSLDGTLGEYVGSLGLTQLRIAETEKYAHVTFFFNGGTEQPYPGEDRVLIPSPKVATYDLLPEMSAVAVTDALLERLDTGGYDLVVLNYANCDMVGHTGVFEAARAAVETVDTCLGRVIDKVLQLGGAALVTSDHGNADQMLEPDSSPFTAHTTNPVPVIAVGVGERKLIAPMQGRLCDLAPTLLDIMGHTPPPQMSGRTLLV
ncbi:MAG: 2,3-bisphosphoglycerate-independent phosphoglycerate mutase [Oscillospiraceae bacterium]|nr:2,3-bisphosphoglycerate-independent phosphoglycerate mutase [Oscillospiraceae bacterium]